MSRICIVSGCSKIEPFMKLSFSTMRTYASFHGYGIKIVTGDDFYFVRGYGVTPSDMPNAKHDEGYWPGWARVPLLYSLIDKYDYLVWLDADTFILDMKRKIEDEFELHTPNKDVFIAIDAEFINIGVMAIKCSDLMKKFLTEWSALGYLDQNRETMSIASKRMINSYDQGGFLQLWERNFQDIMTHTHFLPAKRINAHLQNEVWHSPINEFIEYDQKESFILHMSGMPLELRNKVFHQLKNGAPVNICDEQ